MLEIVVVVVGEVEAYFADSDLLMSYVGVLALIIDVDSCLAKVADAAAFVVDWNFYIDLINHFDDFVPMFFLFINMLYLLHCMMVFTVHKKRIFIIRWNLMEKCRKSITSNSMNEFRNVD